MERTIDFTRDRHMLCDACGARFIVDLDWIDRWDSTKEACPGCGVTCEAERAPKVTVDPNDPALHHNIAQLNWYHTSTHSDWPSSHFDPAARLTPTTRLMMGGEERVQRWAQRQQTKALHVGSYEAAIHNMLRRIDNEGDHGAQFYLYRVQLTPTITVRDDWLIDPSDFVGNVILNDVCPPGIDVARYLNYHEDPGAISLVLGRTAITTIQQIPVPLHPHNDSAWTTVAADALEKTSTTPPSLTGTRPLGRRRAPSPRTKRARKLVKSLANQLPVNLRSQFESANNFDDTCSPLTWARQVHAMANLVLTPNAVLSALDEQRARAI